MKLKKKILSTLLIFAMVMNLVPVTGMRTAAEEAVEISTAADLVTAFATGGTYKLTADVTLDENRLEVGTTETPKTVSLNLNGQTLDLNGLYIYLLAGSVQGEEYSDGSSLTIYDGSTGGRIINGSGMSKRMGGAVYVGAGAVFTMSGGSIEYCGLKEDSDPIVSGGAVYVEDEGTFNMNGGIITDCNACYGGAVAAFGTFNMYNGTIKDCYAADRGGAVDCGDGSFHMYGGTLSGNSALILGGAVNNGESATSFHMHGGTISGNFAGMYGGGVYTIGDCSFDGKCIVKDNYSYHMICESLSDLSEAVKVRDNVFLTVTPSIGYEEGDVLTEGSEIWVTVAEEAEEAQGDLTAMKIRIPTYFATEASSGDEIYFYSDADAYYSVYDSDTTALKLVPRIIQQPNVANGYEVKIDTARLTGNAAYQWMVMTDKAVELKDSDFVIDDDKAELGEIVTGENKIEAKYYSWEASEEYAAGSDYEIYFKFPEGVKEITFTVDSSDVLYDGDVELWNSYGITVKQNGSKWDCKYLLDPEWPDFWVYNTTKTFTIDNVKFIVEEPVTFADTDNILTGGESGKTYYCVVTYPDGSFENSDRVTVPHAHGTGESAVVFETPVTTEAELKTLFTDGGIGCLYADISQLSENLTVEENKTVSLCLNGHSIDLNEKNISVKGGAVLKIYDCAEGENTGTIKNGYTSTDGGAFNVSGSLYLYGGIIDSCTAAQNGGGVYLNLSAGFYMYDGTIQNCSTESGKGGGVNCELGTFHMYGGTITGNLSQNNIGEGGCGGGVHNGASASSFHMHGGSITGNYAWNAGGGIYNAKDTSFDGRCIVKDNYSYGGNAITDANKVLDNLYTFVKVTVGAGGSGETYTGKGVLLEGSEIGVTLAGGSGPVTFSNGTTDYSMYFKSDSPKYEVLNDTTDADNQFVKLGKNVVAVVIDTDGESVISEHYTVQLAIDEATAGQTVKMLKNSTENVTVGSASDRTKNITLDLNGKTLRSTGTVNTIKHNAVTNHATLTIADSSTEKSGMITGGTGAAIGISSIGGGVYNTGGTLIITGGTITGNTASLGGGVANVDNGEAKGTFIMTGGTITGNAGWTKGGGVFNEGIMKVSGTANISGNKNGTEAAAAASNVYLSSGKTITVSAALTSGASIGITTQTDPTAGSPINITGANGTSDYSTYFTCDNTAYDIVESGTNTALTVAIGIPVAKITKSGITKKFDTVQKAVDFAGSGDTVVLIANSAENVTVAGDDNITLDLNGFVLKGNGSSVITNNGILTVKDSGTSSHKWVPDGTTGLWVLDDDFDTADKTLNRDYFVTTGGVITGGKGTIESSTLYGGGIYNNGTLAIEGGCIVGNSADTAGGVYNNGTLTICGSALITGNKALTAGGVYNAPDSTVTVTGGTITGNAATLTVGGGMLISPNVSATVGGTAKIYGNTGAAGNNLTIVSPFAVGTGEDAPVSGMNVGISLLTVPGFAATTGAFTKNGTSDDAQYFISDSLAYKVKYNNNGTTDVTTDDYLELVNFDIGTVSANTVSVTLEKDDMTEEQAKAIAAAQKNSITNSTVIAYAKGSGFATDGRYSVITSSDGSTWTAGNAMTLAEMKADSAKDYFVIGSVTDHTHSWTYAEGGTGKENMLLAYCTADNCDGTAISAATAQTLTISAPTLTTYGETGKSEKATLSGTALGGLTVSADDIKYYQKSGGSYDTTAIAAPTAAGSYKAVITVNDGTTDYTAYVEYTIAEKKTEVCNYTEALAAGEHVLVLGCKAVGTFTIEGSSCKGYTLKNADGQYIAFSDNALILSASSYTWKYDGGLYAEVKTTTTTSRCGCRGWFSWGKKTVTTTTATRYYLSFNGTDLILTTCQVCACIQVTADHHTWAYLHNGDGKHEAYCTKCGHREDPEAHDFTYDSENHKCFCGVIDPDYGGVTEVSVKETVNTSTSYNRGWGRCGCTGKTKVSSYTYKISTKQTGVTVKKVEYCTDGNIWKSGSEFKSTNKLSSFSIRVTDSNGKETYWKYESGKVSKVTE